MFTYRNTTDADLTVINVGVVAPGKTIQSEEELNLPGLEPVERKKETAPKQS